MHFNMRKKYLLSFALLLAGATAANAQVVMSEDFSAEQTKTATDVGYYEFINTQEGDEREVKDGALHFYNTDAVVGQNWQRAIKFRNLPIEENTSYRVTLKLMGSNTYYSLDDDAQVRTNARFALMQGGENLDMGFLASNGEQQFSDISRFQEPETGYYTYTGMFYYTTDAAQKAWYKEQNPTKDELPATYFLTLNVYNPGDFYIDDIIVEKANIQGVQFYNDVIKVNFGYAISTANLNGADRLLLPNDCVTVKLNGKQVNIMTVELRKDGNFYIFLDDEYPGDGTYDEKNTKVEVSFTNPTDAAYQLQYANGKTPGGAVMNFADEVAAYNEGQEDVYSFAFETPTLVSTDPENGSFNLPVDMKEFKFTFNKPVDCTLVEARLDNEKLTVSPAEGVSDVLTFTRGAGDLAAGEYTLTVTKIFPEAMLYEEEFGTEKLTLSFGKVTVDPNDTVRVEMTDGFVEAGQGNYPEKWVVMNENTLKTSASDNWGSGSRLIGGFSGDDITVGMYLSGRSGSESYAEYGSKEAAEDKFLLKPGKYVLTFNACTWDSGDDRTVCYEVRDEAGKVLTSGQAPTHTAGITGSQKVFQAPSTKVEANFRVAAESNIIIKVWGLDANGNNGGWGDAIFFGNMQVKYLPAAAGVEETAILLNALADAKAALENNSDERYLGADYDALEATIKAYEGKETVFTAPSQFRNAAAELNAAAAALKAHRSLCDTYDPLVDNAKAARDMRTGTKFERHEGYAAIEAAIAKYEGKVLTDNAELQEAITVLQNTTGLMQNIGRVVETYLSSMVSGLATLELLGASDEALTAEVNDLLTDDATVKAKVKNAIWKTINTQLSDPANQVFAVKQDPDTFEEFRDSLNLSVFINNPELYYTSWDDKAPASILNKPLPSTENLPGWQLNNVQKGWDMAYHYPWGANAQYAYNEITCPAADGMISSWTSSFDLEQTIQNLPVGKYTLTVGMSERVQDEVASYAFAKTTETELQAAPANLGGGTEPGPNAIVIPGIEVNDGVLTIGAHVANTDHPFINSFHLYMVNAKEGYDYAAGIANVNNEATVRRVEWFDLNGRRVNSAARGVVIQKQTMSDGTVRANKVVK